MLKFRLFLIFSLFIATLTEAQNDDGVLRVDEFRKSRERDILMIPNIDGYLTLKCDFHTHTVKIFNGLNGKYPGQPGMVAVHVQKSPGNRQS